MTNNRLTLRQLLDFQPDDDREKEIYNSNQSVLYKMKLDLEKNMYYLGGQLKMEYDDEINLNSFDIVREIDRNREIEYRGPCNSWEAMSINNHRLQLQETENIVKKYLEVIKWREGKLPPPPPI
jgi:hypothetical protein